jgi:hypothetical protein
MAVHDDEEEYASMYGESPWTTTPGNVLAQLNLALEERILLAGRASAVSPVLAAIIAEVGRSSTRRSRGLSLTRQSSALTGSSTCSIHTSANSSSPVSRLDGTAEPLPYSSRRARTRTPQDRCWLDT